jgi:hypothetical protein
LNGNENAVKKFIKRKFLKIFEKVAKVKKRITVRVAAKV